MDGREMEEKIGRGDEWKGERETDRKKRGEIEGKKESGYGWKEWGD